MPYDLPQENKSETIESEGDESSLGEGESSYGDVSSDSQVTDEGANNYAPAHLEPRSEIPYPPPRDYQEVNQSNSPGSNDYGSSGEE